VPVGTGGGTVTIDEIAPTEAPPSGFTFVGQQVDITAPTASVGDPLILTFNLHSSIAGTDPNAIEIFKAGVLVGACTNPGATPDPCVESRTLIGDGIQIIIRTSTASTWNFGQSDGDGDGVPNVVDNCVTVLNPGQEDSDGDLCGNQCDADYNQDSLISILDFGTFQTCFTGAFQGVCDHAGSTPGALDGLVSILDFGVFQQQFAARVPGPGQSALCDGQ
jgi:hypothetical protein